MDQPDILELAVYYLPGVLMVVLSIMLLARRTTTAAVLMFIGSVLTLTVRLFWRFYQQDWMDGGGYDSYLILVYVRALFGSAAYSLFGIGVLLLVKRHLRGGAPDPLHDGGLFEDPGTAISMAGEIEALYRGMVLYFALGMSALFLSIILFFVAMGFRADEGSVVLLCLGVLGAIVLWVLFTVKSCQLHYRHWRVAIERTGFSEFTAAQAVGFLFIPLFNFYWMFRSYSALSEALYQAGRDPRYGGRTPIINTDTSRALCVINIFTVVPYLGALAGIVNIFLWFNVHAQHRRACTHMLRAVAFVPPAQDQS